MEENFIVSINFSDAGRAALGLKDGLPNGYPQPHDLASLRLVQSGDFVRLQGIPHLWAVQYRVWHLMEDQTVLKLRLDGPIQDD